VDKDEAEVLLWQKMLEPFDKHGRLDIDACMDSFWPYLEANRRTANTVFHVSLDPSPEDKLTDEQLRKIACEYMERMGYGEQAIFRSCSSVSLSSGEGFSEAWKTVFVVLRLASRYGMKLSMQASMSRRPHLSYGSSIFCQRSTSASSLSTFSLL
jgi:hypothetical protein